MDLLMGCARRLSAAVLAAGAALSTPAGALTQTERQLIVKSIRDGQLPTVEAATGGLDGLPLLTLDLSLDIPARRVRGTARLDWRNTTGKPVSVLPVRLAANSSSKKGPEVTWTHLRVTMPGDAAVDARVAKASTTILNVTLPKPLAPDARVVLDGELDGKMVRIRPGATDPVQASMSAIMGGGAAKADGEEYGTFACGDGICTLTGFTPEVPAFIDGGFDTAEGSGIGDATFSEPLNLLLGIVTAKGVTLAVTGIEVGRVASSTHQQRTSFAMAAAREVGIVASEHFIVKSQDVAGVRVRSIALDSDADGAATALKAAGESLTTFEGAFGSYPWSFLDIAEAALVGGAGGVELPALALDGSGFYHQGDNLLAMLGGMGANGDGMFGSVLDFITRHEVAHQWWHAQVGSHAQIHPYIDEPLAQWSALYSVERNQGPEAAETARATQVAVNFQALSMLGYHDGKVARPAGEFSSPVEYAGIVYGKAPLFYDAACKAFGEDKVVAGLRILNEHMRFKRATPDDVWSALVTGAGPKNAPLLQQMWRRWFLEAHGAEDLGGLDFSKFGAMAGIPPELLSGAGNMKLDPATTRQLLEQLKEMMNGMTPPDDNGQEPRPLRRRVPRPRPPCGPGGLPDDIPGSRTAPRHRALSGVRAWRRRLGAHGALLRIRAGREAGRLRVRLGGLSQDGSDAALPRRIHGHPGPGAVGERTRHDRRGAVADPRHLHGTTAGGERQDRGDSRRLPAAVRRGERAASHEPGEGVVLVHPFSNSYRDAQAVGAAASNPSASERKRWFARKALSSRSATSARLHCALRRAGPVARTMSLFGRNACCTSKAQFGSVRSATRLAGEFARATGPLIPGRATGPALLRASRADPGVRSSCERSRRSASAGARSTLLRCGSCGWTECRRYSAESARRPWTSSLSGGWSAASASKSFCAASVCRDTSSVFFAFFASRRSWPCAWMASSSDSGTIVLSG
jgi:hypothetical protein